MMKKIFIFFIIVFCFILISCQAEEVTQPEPLPPAEELVEEPIEEPPVEEPVEEFELLSFWETDKFPGELTFALYLPPGTNRETSEGILWQNERREDNKITIYLKNESNFSFNIRVMVLNEEDNRVIAEIDLDAIEIYPNKNYELVFVWHGEFPVGSLVMVVPMSLLR